MKPVLQALVLAERVYTDRSGKKIIAGTFNAIGIGKLPVPKLDRGDGSSVQLIPGGTDPGCPALYISLTDVVDGTDITLQFVNVSKNQVVFETMFKIGPQNRLATVEIIAPLPPIIKIAREEGAFSFDLVWKGEILGSYRLLVEAIDKST